MAPLVIVESPTKAKKIKEFLGGSADVASAPTVLASVGHVRDLARKVKELPPAVQKERWARLAIDTDHGFEPYYVVPESKKSVIAELRKALKGADALYLATDEDREGEAIAWHLLEVLKPNRSLPVHRMVFHEITAPAIREAFANPRELNMRLVNAQETRRLLDRLYGYDVSEVAWKKVNPGLSAGRVQSVATRLVVEREREIMAFVPAGWWDLEGSFRATGDDVDEDERGAFTARMVALDGTRLATGGDFGDDGELTRQDRVVLDEVTATALAAELAPADFAVRSVESKPYRKRPFAPFITSTLQQVAGRSLRVSAKQVMSMAQRLYQDGYITYMRTDSTALSDAAVAAARREATERYGAASIPSSPRSYAKKVANAQEAHEAIRPSGDRFRAPEEVAREVEPGLARLYELIWRRTVASQMVDALGETVTVRLGAATASGRDAEFSASGTVITERGWMQVEPWRGDDDEERRLPKLSAGDALDADDVRAEGHSTKPPARFTEASLVAKLEELGVGRPSTYASIMETIQNRGYVFKKGSALIPSWTAFAVTTMLERHFAELVDYGFTRELEEVLDAISNGGAEMVPTLEDFYFGPLGEDGERHNGLRDLVTDRLPEIDAAEINSFRIGEDGSGTPVVAKPGRYGPYVQRGTDTASIPDDLPPADLDVERALELLAMPKGGKPLGDDPASGLTVLVMNGRYGPYVQLGEIDDDPDGKPKRASLFAAMDPTDISLDDALRLLSLPRVVGTAPDGEEILAQNGKFGPYLTKGTETKDSRSLAAEEELFSVTLEQALALFAEPKRRGRAAAKPPLAELGTDPVTGRPMVVKDGRFGPYVTDGETNASLRAGDEPATLSAERAAELLQVRRDAVANGEVPTKKRAAKKRAAKKTAKKATKKAARSGTKGARGGDGIASTVTRTVAAGTSAAAQKAAARTRDAS
jgi:DNA topoisomerase-1